ncbi:MAG: nicotinate-nucleotide adenylyltransferase [Longimicrobiales bacterium]
MRVGLFGGTFDPPHSGHLIVAQDALIRLGLDRLIFIPAATPPHKQDREITPAAIRLAMLRAATAEDPRFEVDDLEIRRAGPSYTVDTLRAYLSAQPDAELFLIVGADQYEEMNTWHEADEVRRLARLAVLSRAGCVAEQANEHVAAVPVTRIDISATDIRKRIRAHEPIRYLVPAAVEELITRHRLYRPVAG